MTMHITRRLISVAGKSFSPLGGAAGSGSQDSPRFESCHDSVSIPSEVGRGRAQPHSHAGTALPRQVSISSEVGRGRAPRCEGKGVQTQDDWFQSPRRWGGVGLVHLASPAQRLRLLSFNPLGGGAGSGSQSCPAQAGSGLEFQSPRRWGRARDRRGATTHRCEASFNPHGGGAGSGSRHMQKAMEQISASGFQSPRRWGGVGLVPYAKLKARSPEV